MNSPSSISDEHHASPPVDSIAERAVSAPVAHTGEGLSAGRPTTCVALSLRASVAKAGPKYCVAAHAVNGGDNGTAGATATVAEALSVRADFDIVILLSSTLPAFTSVPNRRLATRATSRCCSPSVPAGASVADVPMQRRSLAWHASRTRRTRRATSASWRPRYVWRSSSTRKSRPRAARTSCLSRTRVRTSSASRSWSG